MAPFFTWIRENPQSAKAFLTTFLALVIKLVLQLSGKSAELERWNDAQSQIVDLVVYAFGAYGMVAGAIHASRGPALTPVDQAATIVAAIQGPPAASAMADVREAVKEVEAQQK